MELWNFRPALLSPILPSGGQSEKKQDKEILGSISAVAFPTNRGHTVD